MEPWKDKRLLCSDLPSRPRPDIGRVLVTGASGYIGGRLVPELMARGYTVRVMVRAASPEYKDLWPGAEIGVADALDPAGLRVVLEDVHTAYYLIHSLILGPREFEKAEIQAAVNFREAARDAGVKRIIYLGGLGDVRTKLSSHLQSRVLVAEELKKGDAPVTVLRAAIVIGSGSASYEIIQHLVRRLPVFLIPPWSMNDCQPIGIRDVVKYLVGVLEIPESSGRSFDIGGGDILPYHVMLKILAELLNKKRYFIRFPYFPVRLYAYIASLLTPVPASITRSLMEGLKNEAVCRDGRIKEVLPFEPISYREAVIRAMNREEQDNVSTRWTGAYPPAHELVMKLHELKRAPRYTASYFLNSVKEASSLFASICTVGGKEGWFSRNWMWRLRGFADKILMGVGSSRGRRSQSTLKVNDVIDFWRIEDLQPPRRLLLRAEMKLPGKAWLEFSVMDERLVRRLRVTAYYETRTFWGRIYWYVFLPFHGFIFKDLIKQIEKRSE